MLKKLNIKVFILSLLLSNYTLLLLAQEKAGDVCPGEKGVTYYVISDPNSTYFWSIENGDITYPGGNEFNDTIIVDWIESSDVVKKYHLSVVEVSPQGCMGDTVEVDIGFKDSLKIILLNGAYSASICEGSILELDAGPGFVAYYWNGERGGQIYYVTEDGQYEVKGITPAGCESSDKVTVRVNSLPEVEIGDTVQICREEIEFDAGPYDVFSWSTGENTQTIKIGEQEKDSLFWVTVIDFNECVGSDTLLVLKCSTPISVPDAFTPNPEPDGYNDFWVIEGIDRFENAEVRVFNRKKMLVFESIGPYQPWDGKAGNGKVVPVDSYHYIIDLKDPEFPVMQGIVTVVY